MRVTVHPSSRIPEEAKLHAYSRITSPEQLLSSITTDEHGPSSLSSRGRPSGQAQKNLIQSSFSSLSQGSNTYAAKNGLVYTIIEAYNNHHNLILRPDDVWLAILSQLSVYINGNADALRHLFVADKGRKELFIEVDLSSPTLDHGAVATRMAGLLAENLLIKDLDRDFILPDFTTTTDTERATAAVMFMGTMQKYFVYSWGTRCGLPAVTLLGEVDDWTKIHDRVAKFLGGGLFGPMAAQWLSSLGPVLKRFIETFKTPRSEQVKRFWGTIVKENKPNGSGGITYSGWMVGAFCWFDERGRVLGGYKGREIGRSEVPMGFVKVPVTLLHWGQKIEAEMVAGLVGMEAEASNSEVLKKLFGLPLQRMGGQTKVDTLMPVSGWFMYRV